MRIEIVRDEGELRRHRYVFVTFDRSYQGWSVVLEAYFNEERQTKRHKWGIAQAYWRASWKQRETPQSKIVDRPDVPQDVIDEALAKVRALVVYEG